MLKEKLAEAGALAAVLPNKGAAGAADPEQPKLASSRNAMHQSSRMTQPAPYFNNALKYTKHAQRRQEVC